MAKERMWPLAPALRVLWETAVSIPFHLANTKSCPFYYFIGSVQITSECNVGLTITYMRGFHLGHRKVSVVHINWCLYKAAYNFRENIYAFYQDIRNCPLEGVCRAGF